MKCGAEAGLAGKSQWEERMSDAVLRKGLQWLCSVQKWDVFLSDFDGVWRTEPRLH